MFDALRFRLLHPLILSLMIHAVILVGVVNVLPMRLDVPAAMLKVVIATDRAHATAPVEAKPVLPPPVPRSTAVSEPGVKPAVVHARPVVTSLERLPALPVVAPAPVADGAGGPTGAPATAAGTGSSDVPAMPRDGLSANDLRQYRVALAIAARRFKHYPALARERGLEGTTEVALTVSSHLPEPEVVLVRSSGHVVLDRQAQEMMAQAARTTVVPESLRGRDFRILLPVLFSLDGDQ